mmetsp:Transcript_69442/g.131001  ORF Transcript_69442/g.131001 Transcript_69442/m.131001 type:complete len:433 (-) Transcript_69442:47-1345(-)
MAFPQRMVAEDVPLTKGRYGFGVSWDSIGGRDVDIDLQCVVVDSKGVITDCAYYNNLKAGRAITHSGDEVAGKRAGNIQEMIWVTMRKLQAQVSVLLFVIAAYAGGQLQDVSGGRFHICEEHESHQIAVFDLERSRASVKVVGAAFKGSMSGVADWKMRMLQHPAQRGQHFMDILPHLAEIICEFLPHAPKKQKVAFAMEKGSVLALPMEMGRITVGLGWDVDEGECDLDVSAVLLDRDGADLEAVFFGRLESEEHGIVHTGDNLTGEGDGDDEQITVQLSALGDSVHDVFFCIHIYSKGRGGRPKTFREVANPYCRVVEGTAGDELCRYTLTEAGDRSGLIIARLRRSPDGRWGFNAMGIPSKGTMYKDSIGDMQRMTKVDPRTLQRADTKALRSQPTLTLEGAPEAAHVPLMPVIAEAPASDSKACCSVQ